MSMILDDIISCIFRIISFTANVAYEISQNREVYCILFCLSKEFYGHGRAAGRPDGWPDGLRAFS
jgi:hypothetical protein